MKPIVFLGDTLEVIRDFPYGIRQAAGFQLDKVQRGLTPDDYKQLPVVGKGVQEIRIRDISGTYRVIYIARFENAVYVLHAFKKKTQRTPALDLRLAKARMMQIIKR
ncbi:MAG: type II toxin-antitoxin system RelE/ParE family toxin [Gammaproteobacteria bacterium]|nr:MAG: type II toxin-antitoxin system RelE/ParE family toxin [Gammaproteobacteria bacterium]